MTDQPQNPVSDDPSAGTQNTEHMIPKSRFDEVNNRYKEMADRVEKLEAERKQQEAQDLAKQHRYQELYEKAQAEIEQLKQVQQQAQSYRQQIEAYNRADIDRVPEDKRHLIPDFDDPVKLRDYLNRALPSLIEAAPPKPPKLDGGAGSSTTRGQVVKLTEAELQIAAASGISAEDYARYKAQQSTNVFVNNQED